MLAMAGHTVESYMLLRGCIEASLYALHIETNPKLADVWLNRHDNQKSEEACRTHFSYGAVKQTLKAKSEQHYKIMSKLYQITIDFGGHPNEPAITGNLKLSKEGGKTVFHHHYIVGDSKQLDHALKTTAQIGACSLRTLQFARPQYFTEFGISAMIDEATQGI